MSITKPGDGEQKSLLQEKLEALEATDEVKNNQGFQYIISKIRKHGRLPSSQEYMNAFQLHGSMAQETAQATLSRFQELMEGHGLSFSEDSIVVKTSFVPGGQAYSTVEANKVAVKETTEG